MAIFSPLFSLLGEWVPQLSLSFRHPNVATGSTHPIHIRLTGTSDTSRIHNLHGDTQNLTTLPEACPAILHIRHPIPSNRSGEARVCRVVGSCPSIPYSHFAPPPPSLWTVFFYSFFMRFLQIACWEHDGITKSGCMQETGTGAETQGHAAYLDFTCLLPSAWPAACR
ncbi:hypothetical protein F4776DRAFT_590784 [Hypoxylon sp. NC0597]|nr:hypothetical protein F4776DRAFT_590784 [Hypoxylon sp. NC0597]